MTRSAKKRERDERRKAERELKHRGILDNDNRSATGLQTRRRPLFRRASVFLAALLSLASAHGAAWVTGTIVDSNTATANESLVFVPLSTPQTDGGTLIRSGNISITATNGVFEVELEQGDYRVTINNRDRFLISVPNDGSTNVINSLITSQLTYSYQTPPATSATFGGLSDVDMAGVTDGQVPTYNAASGKYEPGDGGGGGGSGDAIQVEDGNELGTFSAADTTARFADTGDVNFSLADGGEGGPDEIYANLRPSVVGTGEIADGTIGPNDMNTGVAFQFDSINIGHASDTTLTRTGAGDMALEGNQVYRAGGTDVPVADGGTGSSTASGARTALGLVIGTDVQAYSANLAALASAGSSGSGTFLRSTLAVPANSWLKSGASQELTAVSGIAASDISSGQVAIANGGTGASTASGARTALGLVIGTDVLAPNGDGSLLTALNASQLTSGTVPDAAIPEEVPLTDEANAFTAQQTVSFGVRQTQTDLNGGTSLTVGTHYYDSLDLSSNPTLTFSGTPTQGDTIRTTLKVTTAGTLNFPTSEVVGSDGTTTTSKLLWTGEHDLVWIYKGDGSGGSEWLVELPGPRNNETTSDPSAATDDITLGYSVGSLWVNTAADRAWRCVDNTDGAAVWINTTERVESEPFTILEPDTVQGISDIVLLKHFPAEKYPNGVTLLSIHVGASASYTSETFNFEESASPTGSTPSTLETITLTAATGEDDGTFTDAAIAADSYIFVDLDDTPEDVAYVAITLTWELNP